MSGRYRGILAAMLATLVLVAGAGCSSDDDKANAGNGGKVEKITYMTAFGAVGRDALVWVAKDKGWFKEAGFDVDIQLGAGTDTALKAVTSGQAQFALVDMTGAMINTGTGKFKGVKTIAAIHQQTLVSIMTVEGSGITQPKDLVGKRLGAATASVNQLLFPAYAKLAGFNDKDVKFQDLQTTQLGSTLAAGQVDAVSTFLIGRGGLEIATKKKIVTLPYGDYLRDLFGNSLITTDEIATKKSDMAKRFRDVIIKSLQYTIEHPEEAADIMIKDQKAANKAAAVGEIKLMAPYVKTSSGAIGVVEEAKVNRAIAILQGSGLIPAGLTADQVVALDLAPKA